MTDVGDNGNQRAQERPSLVPRWRLMLAATRDDRLSRSDCAVLGAVLDRMAGGVAWPALATIAKDAGVSARTAPRSIARLVDLGYLLRESGNGATSNRYRAGSVLAGADEAETTDEAVSTDEIVSTDEADIGVLTNSSGEVLTNSSYESATRSLKQSAKAQERARRAPKAAETSAPKPRREQKPKAPLDLSAVEVPDWLPPDTWRDYIEHRQQVRKPLTTLAAAKAIAQLTRFRDDGHDPVAVIDASIANGWQGLFAPRGGGASRSKTAQALENLARFSADAQRYEGAAGRVRRKIREHREARELAGGREIDGEFSLA